MPTVLLVDDEPHLSFMVARALRGRGIDVASAKDGGQAFDAAVASTPDLVITDLQMPVLDGLEFSRRLRQDPRTAHVPVIMITGRGHRIPPQVLGETNIRALLPKPFSLQDVLRSVDEILDLPGADARPALGEAA